MSRSIKMAYIRPRPNPDFAVATVVEEVDGKLIVRKIPTNPKAQKHVLGMKHGYDLLVKSKINNTIKIVAPISSSSEEFTVNFIKGERLEHKLQEMLFAKELKGFIFEMDKLKQLIDSLSTDKDDNKLPFTNNAAVSKFKGHLAPGLLDINADNILIDKNNQWHLFDYEWCFNGTIPKDYVFVRGLYWFFERTSYGMQSLDFEYVKVSKKVFLPKSIYNHYKTELHNLKQVLELEKKFQSYVDASTTFDDSAITPVKYAPERILLAQKYTDLQKSMIEADSIIKAKAEEVAILRKHISDVEGSKSYKLARKISGGYNKLKN